MAFFFSDSIIDRVKSQQILRRVFMYFSDLQKFINHLEATGGLKRVKDQVDPYLEVTEIVNRACKDSVDNCALIFEKVKGSSLPLDA